MSIWKPLRTLCIKTTDLTHGYQGQNEKLVSLYKLWSYCYDFSVKLDPAYPGKLKQMIDTVVRRGDTVLDIGCGTGIGTLHASRIADKVIGIDLSPAMIDKLKRKIHRQKIANIEVVLGEFPESLSCNAKFNSIISSFAIVHFTVAQRRMIYQHIFRHLVRNGRLGLFSAQGEIAATFETKDEIITNLRSTGFQNINIDDVSDIYRIVRTEKP